EMGTESLGSVPDALIDSGRTFGKAGLWGGARVAWQPPSVAVATALRLLRPAADLFEASGTRAGRSGAGRCRCLGGRRISHQSGAKKIHVYGGPEDWGGHPEAIQQVSQGI
uniref:Uncharacterized protein n=1 Tax=Laticauda laticaudata TaxID=8630 RepID=A0A8C5REB3_LATLA